jgi:crotonobetainyl-CoA:carnitine CoA-transferase CaiB-like acyl-CoA transferase
MLADVSVLDLSIWRPGPYATSLLAHMGADVVKVEPPGGDPMRYYPELFESVNAGKRSIVLDLKEPVDLERALELADQADVVVEGFRPGVMARFGLDEPTIRARNDRVVYCSISGYGQEGALARLPGHDVNYQAWAGSLAPDGGAATMPPLPVADLASGMTAAFGICAALLGRGVDGQGSYLDISMTDVLATWTGPPATTSDGAGTSAAPTEPSGTSRVPGYGLFDTADGNQIALGVVNEQHFWVSLCHVLDLADLADISFEERTQRSTEVNAAVAQALARRKRDELVAALTAAGVPVAPVLDRATMAGSAALPVLPMFPIRRLLDQVDGNLAPAPALNEHAGQGFAS